MRNSIFRFIIWLCVTAFSFELLAQNVTINPNGITPALSGSYPRLSYNSILALTNPQTGDMAYDLTFLCMRVYNGAKWVCTYQLPNDQTPNMTAMVTINASISANSLCTDSGGNIYILGSFNGSANFGGITKTSAGGADIFIAKYTNNGSLLWVQTTGGTDYEGGLKMVLDADNNIYVTGYFMGTTNIGGTSKTSAGTQDIFIAKYSNSGNFQWVQMVGGTSDDHGRDIALDKNGNVYITGNFNDTFTFGNTIVTSVGSEDFFLAKYSSDGLFQWVKTAGGTGEDRGIGVKIDSVNSIYVTGQCSSNILFNGSVEPYPVVGRVFIAKYNSNGDFQFAITTGSGSGSMYVSDMVMDSEGRLYISGGFSGTVTLGYLSRTAIDRSDIFTAKFIPITSNSGYWDWIRIEGGKDSELALAMAIDKKDNIYITGHFEGIPTFGNSSKITNGEKDLFVMKYNKTGLFQWVQTAGGAKADEGRALSLDSNGNVFVIGNFSNTVLFGNTIKTATSNIAFFLARLQQ